MMDSDKIIPRFSTVIDYRSRINAAMKFIQENSGENLDIKTVSEVANFSPYHFHRIFAGFVGETLSDYIKKVRMKKAASLLSTDVKVSEVAIEAGYLTTSAFSKVFRQTFGMTPSEFKNIRSTENLKFSPSDVYDRRHQPLVLQPKIIEEPSHTLYFIRMKVKCDGLLNENIGEAFHTAFDRWYEIIDSCALWGNIHKRVGVFRSLNSISPEKCDYDAGMIFNKKVALQGHKEVKISEVKQGRWAVFLHKGPYNTLWQTWNWIYNYWCSVNGVQLRDVTPYEVYLNYKSQTAPEDLLTEIYIPIY